MVTPMNPATRPHCSAYASGRIASDWGEKFVPCQTWKGLRSTIDSSGIERRFCGAPGHRAQVERRFGRLSEATRIALAIERISRDFHSSLYDPETDDESEFLDDRNPEGDPTLNGAFR